MAIGRLKYNRDLNGMHMNLVLVYLGNPVPLYLMHNLEYLRLSFPEEKVWLISDLPSNQRCAERAQANFFLCKNPRKQWSELYESMNHKKNYRSGFWFNTKARLLVLEEFFIRNDDAPVLHIEGDIWLSPRFPMGLVSAIEKDFAFPITSMNSGIASTFFIRNREASSKLISKVIEVSKSNPAATDVDILGQLWESSPTDVEILPNSIPSNNPVGSDSKVKLLSLMSSNIQKFDGLFDASTFGVHLTGLDPRNRYGVREIYNAVSDHAVDVTAYEFYFENGFPFASYKKAKYPIFSLHIHSKDKRFFSYKNWQSVMSRRIMQRRALPIFEFSMPGLFGFVSDYFHLLFKYLIRRMLK